MLKKAGFKIPPFQISDKGLVYMRWLMGLEPQERKTYLAKRELEAQKEIIYFCKTCKNCGFIYYPTQDKNDVKWGKTIICPDCQGKGSSHDPFTGKKKWEMNFEHWFATKGTEQALRLAKSWSDGSADFIWLLIYGEHGNGKTHLAKASKELLRKRGCVVAYLYAVNIFDDLRASIDNKNMPERIEFYQNTQYLIIDDFFLDSKSDWLPAKIEQILNYRYENYQPTLITLNGQPAEILSPALLSRFKDTERSRMCLIKAGDYRPKK